MSGAKTSQLDSRTRSAVGLPLHDDPMRRLPTRGADCALRGPRGRRADPGPWVVSAELCACKSRLGRLVEVGTKRLRWVDDAGLKWCYAIAVDCRLVRLLHWMFL